MSPHANRCSTTNNKTGSAARTSLIDNLESSSIGNNNQSSNSARKNEPNPHISSGNNNSIVSTNNLSSNNAENIENEDNEFHQLRSSFNVTCHNLIANLNYDNDDESINKNTNKIIHQSV